VTTKKKKKKKNYRGKAQKDQYYFQAI
jgi:hypothetical protein